MRVKLKEIIEWRKVAAGLNLELQRYSLLGFKTAEVMEKTAQFEGLVNELMKKIAELEDIGVRVKDLDYGIVDFPAEKYGRNVLLCWRFGEPEVSYWHENNECFDERKPLKVQSIQP